MTTNTTALTPAALANLSAFLDNAAMFIGYWASVERIGDLGIVTALHVDEPDPEYDAATVDRPALLAAVRKLVSGEVKVGAPVRRKLATFLGLLDVPDGLYLAQLEGEPDPLDCAVQVACFGEVVYG